LFVCFYVIIYLCHLNLVVCCSLLVVCFGECKFAINIEMKGGFGIIIYLLKLLNKDMSRSYDLFAN
jgi:hypothetical protein